MRGSHARGGSPSKLFPSSMTSFAKVGGAFSLPGLLTPFDAAAAAAIVIDEQIVGQVLGVLISLV